jgi:hypothetical protein
MWRSVVKHFRWSKGMEDLATASLRSLLGVSEHEPIPPVSESVVLDVAPLIAFPQFISIHARHNDFRDYCGDYTLKECYASILVIARRVEEVKAELYERKGLVVDRVVMTSDEKDEAWWEDVRRMGWVPVDHGALRTVEAHGKWYAALLCRRWSVQSY